MNQTIEVSAAGGYLPPKWEVRETVDGLLADDVGDVVIDGDGPDPECELSMMRIAQEEGLTKRQVWIATRSASKRLVMRLYILDEMERLEHIDKEGIFSNDEIDEIVAIKLSNIIENFGFEYLMQIVAGRRLEK